MPPKKSNHKTKASFDDIFDTQLNIDKLIEKAKKQGKSKIKIKIDGKEIEINLKENKDSIWNKILKITLGTAAAAGAGALAYYGYKNKDDLMKAVKDYYNSGKTGAKKLGADISKFATDKYNVVKDYANKKYQQIDDYFHPKGLIPAYDNAYENKYQPKTEYINPDSKYNKPMPGNALIPAYPDAYDMHGPEYINPNSKYNIPMELPITDLIPAYRNAYDRHLEYIPHWGNSVSEPLTEIKEYIEKTPRASLGHAEDLLNKALENLPHKAWRYSFLKSPMKEFSDNVNDLVIAQIENGNEADMERYKQNIYNILDSIEYLANKPPDLYR